MGEQTGEYLEAINEGQLESTGSFSLDWGQARQKLVEDALKNPQHFLELLLQWLVDSSFNPDGPSEPIRIANDATRMRFSWTPHCGVGPKEWSDIQDRLLTCQLPSPQSPTYRLERVLQLIGGRDDLSIYVALPGVGQIQIAAEQVRSYDAPNMKAIIQLEIIDPKKRPKRVGLFSLDLTQAGIHASWPEFYAVSNRLQFSPVPIIYRGKLLHHFNSSEETILLAWAVRSQDPNQNRLGVVAQGFGKFGFACVDPQGNLTPRPPSEFQGVERYKTLFYLKHVNSEHQATHPTLCAFFQGGLPVHDFTAFRFSGVSCIASDPHWNYSLGGEVIVDDRWAQTVSEVQELAPKFCQWAKHRTREMSYGKILFNPLLYLALKASPGLKH